MRGDEGAVDEELGVAEVPVDAEAVRRADQGVRQFREVLTRAVISARDELAVSAEADVRPRRCIEGLAEPDKAERAAAEGCDELERASGPVEEPRCWHERRRP